MTSRNILMREMFLLALSIGAVIILTLVVGLSVGGMFSLVWLARAILGTALVVGGIELLILPRALRTNHVRGPLATWRVTDRSQGCGVVLLGALITAGLLACGGLLEFVLEWK